jgi:hypothetical protein
LDLGSWELGPLTSNGCALPRNTEYLGQLSAVDSSAFSSSSARKSFARNGYLFVRGALPREDVLRVREAYFQLFDPIILKDGDARRGDFSGQMPEGLPQHGMRGHPAHQFVRTPLFRHFCSTPVLARMAEAVLGHPVVPLQRTPLRHFVRGSRSASRPHLDRTYLDGDGATNVTIWVPLGDCPLEAGGLLYLEGSHLDPRIEGLARSSLRTDRPHDRRPLTHDLKWLSETTGRRWLGAEYQAGDVVLHSPDIVHASTDCQSAAMRLSTDIRFQRRGTALDARWQSAWAADDGH